MTQAVSTFCSGSQPDIAVFAKAMSNGYAMAAVIGTEPVMQAAQSTFISSTNWTERIGPVAALATIRKYRREKVGKAPDPHRQSRHGRMAGRGAVLRSDTPCRRPSEPESLRPWLTTMRYR